MSGSRVVRNAWDLYRRRVIPPSATNFQLQECRRAFYAGAEMLLVEIMEGLSPGPDAQPADEDLLVAIHTELLAYAQDVKEGRA